MAYTDRVSGSFWIPSLGGQVYAMSGMTTKLHLMADRTGEYTGKSANISGEGFARMNFTVTSVPKGDFNYWTRTIKDSSPALDKERYAEIAKPSEEKKIEYFSLKDNDLYDTIVMKYMNHGHEASGEPATPRQEGETGHGSHEHTHESMPSREGTE